MVRFLNELWKICKFIGWTKLSLRIIFNSRNMRRTIITLDTKDGRYVPVFVVMEELYSDMQDYYSSNYNKRPNSYEKGKDNLSLSIEEFSNDDPFLLNGDMGRMEQIGVYVEEPGNDCYMLLPSICDNLNTLSDVLPHRECPREVKCYIDVNREVWNVLSSSTRLLSQLKYLSTKYLNYDLTLFPEHIGNFYWVRYNPYFKKVSFKESVSPVGISGTIVFRQGQHKPLRIIIKDKHSGYPVYTVSKELTGNERVFSIKTPLPPHLIFIEIQDMDGRVVMYDENVTFVKRIAFDVGVQKLELRLKKQGKKAKDNYEVSIPKYENAGNSVIGEKQGECYNDYFTIADSISRQNADKEALNFVFFDVDDTNVQSVVSQAKEVVRKMIETGHNVCYICDPYFNADDFIEYIYYIKNLSLDIKIIVCKSPKDSAKAYNDRLQALKDIANDYNSKLGRNIVECKGLTGTSFHDRFVYADLTGWLMGSSFSEFGHRTTTISKIPASYSKMILNRIKNWWKEN